MHQLSWGRGRRRPLHTAAYFAASLAFLAALCSLLLGRDEGSDGGTEVAGGLGERLGVTMSSPCITQMRPSCGLHVPGGTLHLTKIRFPDGIDKPGEAYATGVINGQVVYGTVKVHGNTEWEDKVEKDGDADAPLYDKGKAGEGLDPVDAQYQTAIRQVVGNMQKSQDAMSSEAERIAKSVTKVLTSSTVSSSIANLAWNLAEKRWDEAHGVPTSSTEKDAPDDNRGQAAALDTGLFGGAVTGHPGALDTGSLAEALTSRVNTGPSAPEFASQLAATGSGPSTKTKTGQLSDTGAASEPASEHSEAQTPAWEKAMATWKRDGIVGGSGGLSSASTKPEDVPGSAVDLEGGHGVSLFAQDTINSNPAAGVQGPKAGTFSGTVCAGCLVCPGCCQNGWVPGCKGYKQPAEDEGEEPAGNEGGGEAEHEEGGEGSKRLGDVVDSTLMFDPKESIPAFRRIDAEYKKTLQGIEHNSEVRAKQLEEQQKATRMKVRDAHREAQKQLKAFMKTRKSEIREYAGLESIVRPQIASLQNPWGAFSAFEASTHGPFWDASAAHRPTQVVIHSDPARSKQVQISVKYDKSGWV